MFDSIMFFWTGILSATDERLQVALEELQDLKGVWSELAKIWDQIDQMKEQPWLSVQPRKVNFLYLILRWFWSTFYNISLLEQLIIIWLN